jgi:hypothetical protein
MLGIKLFPHITLTVALKLILTLFNVFHNWKITMVLLNSQRQQHCFPALETPEMFKCTKETVDLEEKNVSIKLPQHHN